MITSFMCICFIISSFILWIISSMINNQTKMIERRNFGFNENQVVTYGFKLDEKGTYEDVEPVLAKLNEKYVVTFIRNIEDGLNGFPVQAVVLTGRTDTLKLHLSKGDFLHSSDTNSIIMGQQIYKKLGCPSEVTIGANKFNIKGVCDDMYQTLILVKKDIIRDYFIKNGGFNKEYMTIKVIKDTGTMTKKDRAFIYDALHNTPNVDDCFNFFGTSPKNTFSAAVFQIENKISLNLVVLLIAIFNIIVTSTFWILDRKKEISIRKAFGAQEQNIILLIYKELTVLMLFSIIISLGLQLAFMKPMSSLLRINLSVSLLYLITIFIIAFILIFLASIFPVRRCIKIEISQCLKE